MPDPGVHSQAGAQHIRGGNDFSTGSQPGPGGYGAPPQQQQEERPPDVYGIDQEHSGQGDFWSQILQEVRSQVGRWSKNAGYSTNAGQAFVNQYWPDFIKHFSKTFGSSVLRMGPNHMEMFQMAVHHALNFYGARLPFSVDTSGSGSRGSGRGRGGGGPRRPTPDEIRAQFDLEALSEKVNDMSRLYLIQDHKNPRSIASAYVEAIVKNPDQALEFETFVRGQLKKSPRWGIIMQNKPNGMDEAQYIQMYAQSVMQALGGSDDSEQIAFEQAAIGSSQAGIQERLGRTRSVRSSSKWVNSFEDNIRAVGEVLR